MVGVKKRSQRSLTSANFRGIERQFRLSREAYIWLLENFLLARAGVLENASHNRFITQGRGRKYLARSREELWTKSPHLSEDSNMYQKMPGGWFANMNLSDDVKFGVLSRFAERAHLQCGADWSWKGIQPLTLDDL